MSRSAGSSADDALVGAGLVLYRKVPKLDRFLAYLPEGPVLDWVGAGLGDQLVALSTYLEEPTRIRDPDRPAGRHPTMAGTNVEGGHGRPGTDPAR